MNRKFIMETNPLSKATIYFRYNCYENGKATVRDDKGLKRFVKIDEELILNIDEIIQMGT